MKKSFIVLTVCVLMIMVLGSCGANKKCPAYSQHNTEQNNSSRS